jgi:hypothetical protein
MGRYKSYGKFLKNQIAMFRLRYGIPTEWAGMMSVRELCSSEHLSAGIHVFFE